MPSYLQSSWEWEPLWFAPMPKSRRFRGGKRPWRRWPLGPIEGQPKGTRWQPACTTKGLRPSGRSRRASPTPNTSSHAGCLVSEFALRPGWWWTRRRGSCRQSSRRIRNRRGRRWRLWSRRRPGKWSAFQDTESEPRRRRMWPEKQLNLWVDTRLGQRKEYQC